eukprot:COSAG05_NODE_16068_length_354_cov_0.803922_1_plen_80_part_10
MTDARALPPGEGTFTYAGGDYFTGSWSAGVKHGQGLYFYAESMSQLYGYWSCNTFIGGCWTHKDASTFVGTFPLPAEGED